MKANASTKPVVVAVKEDQPALVEYAADEARRRRTELVVLHVYGVFAAAVELGVVDAIAVSPQDDAAANAVLDDAKRIVDGLAEPLPARYVAEVGAVIETIEKAAAKAQLLVLGADEISWFERLLGGSIARHFAERAPCPVIVVPPIHDLAQLYGGVCVAVELDADAAGPLRFGFDEASARDARLIVLHIATESLDRDGVEAQRLGVAEVLAGWREDFPDVRVATRVVLADEVVAEVARVSGRTELLVVGRPRHHLVFGARAASRLAREAHCPLAIVDEADESAATARVADAGAAR